jgi:hypothetical protein
VRVVGHHGGRSGVLVYVAVVLASGSGSLLARVIDHSFRGIYASTCAANRAQRPGSDAVEKNWLTKLTSGLRIAIRCSRGPWWAQLADPEFVTNDDSQNAGRLIVSCRGFGQDLDQFGDCHLGHFRFRLIEQSMNPSAIVAAERLFGHGRSPLRASRVVL